VYNVLLFIDTVGLESADYFLLDTKIAPNRENLIFLQKIKDLSLAMDNSEIFFKNINSFFKNYLIYGILYQKKNN
jgi:hypothetical protein